MDLGACEKAKAFGGSVQIQNRLGTASEAGLLVNRLCQPGCAWDSLRPRLARAKVWSASG